MRAGFWLLVALVAAIGLALFAQGETGNVTLFVPPHRIDLSLNLAILILAAAFALLHLVMRAVAWTAEMPQRVRAYRERRAAERAQRALADSLAALYEGRYARCEKLAQQAQSGHHAAALSSLNAARAAQAMKEFVRRDAWIERARIAAQGSADASLSSAVRMTDAELALEQGDAERALSILTQLHASGVRHVESMRLLLRANQLQGNWREVLRIARLLEKRNALHEAAVRRLKADAIAALAKPLAGDGPGLRALWKGLSAKERALPEVARQIAIALDGAGDGQLAADLLADALDENWEPRLIAAFGALRAAESMRCIERCERWLATRPGDAALLLALGRHCRSAALWGAAQRYLQQSLSSAPGPEAWRELALMFESTERAGEAASAWREAALAESPGPHPPVRP